VIPIYLLHNQNTTKNFMKPTSALLPLAAILSLCACQKNYDPGSADNSPAYSSLQSAMASVAVTSKTVIFDASKGGTFTGNSGSRYIFQPNSFINSSGNTITGNVQVEVKEYVNKTDMLLSGVLPVTPTEPLLSGGEVSVNATQNGQALNMKAGATFQVNMPKNTKNVPVGMKVFSGTQDPNSGGIIWTENADSTGGTINCFGDTTSIISPNIRFVNADAFMTSPNWQKFTVTITADGVNVTDSLGVYALYDTYNGVWPMLPDAKHVCSENHVPDIPVHFAAIGVINGKLYGGILGATPKTGNNYTVKMEKTTPAAFKAQLQALP
jgi:hypothetical protein